MVTSATPYKHVLHDMPDAPSCLVFYYGAAAQAAATSGPLLQSSHPQSTHALCSAAWVAAGRPMLDRSLQAMGLAQWLDLALAAKRVISVSEAGLHQSHGGQRIALWLNQSPSPEWSQDALTLIMAAASLGPMVTVWVAAPAQALLTAPLAAAWQQLQDHQLAHLQSCSGRPPESPEACVLQP